MELASLAGGCFLAEPRLVFRAGSGSSWHVVPADCGVLESSYGTDSRGVERPAAEPGCR